jgi:hypothetical protein
VLQDRVQWSCDVYPFRASYRCSSSLHG